MKREKVRLCLKTFYEEDEEWVSQCYCCKYGRKTDNPFQQDVMLISTDKIVPIMISRARNRLHRLT